MTTFFTSDTHFGHQNIIEYCNRPFSTFGEMDEEMVRRWNLLVHSKDTVYHLGDFAYGRGATPEYLSGIAKRLNGKIHLVRGNHEKPAQSIPWRFETIKDYDEVDVEGHRIILFHYGLRTWHHDLRGVWHCYGHSHGGLPPHGKSCDVGVDPWGFAPVSFQELKAKMDSLPQGEHPRFQNYPPKVPE